MENDIDLIDKYSDSEDNDEREPYDIKAQASEMPLPLLVTLITIFVGGSMGGRWPKFTSIPAVLSLVAAFLIPRGKQFELFKIGSLVLGSATLASAIATMQARNSGARTGELSLMDRIKLFFNAAKDTLPLPKKMEQPGSETEPNTLGFAPATTDQEYLALMQHLEAMAASQVVDL